MSFAKLDSLHRQLEALSHAQAMLGVDEAVNMPAGGGAARATAMATLAGMYHDLASSAAFGEMLYQAETEQLTPEQSAAIREAKREYLNRSCLTSDFVKRKVETCMRSEQAWRAMRREGDWKNFLPLLSDVVSMTRDEAAMRGARLSLAPYDAMMEQYDPGNRTAWITPLFNDLKLFLHDFLPKALEAQRQKPKRKKLKGPFPIAAQKALGETLMKAVGFDFNHGRLDVSHHPFCGGVPSDVRMTTRYREDEFLSSLMGILHETGHGLYEQGLPKSWSHWGVGAARGMSVHESQSLFNEMQLARRRAFWKFALPQARKAFGAKLKGYTLDDIMRHVNHVAPSLIRVEADEVTYPLHIIMRYELEQALIDGDLEPRHLPDAFNAKMKQYLGLTPSNPMVDGPLQDVHWPAGAVGYFPSYTLGAVMAAQLWEAMGMGNTIEKTKLDSDGLLEQKTWLSQSIWNIGSFESTQSLLNNATGQDLSLVSFQAHLLKRYGTSVADG